MRTRKSSAGAKTIIWNGPMGVFEMPPFDRGTVGVGEGRGRVGSGERGRRRRFGESDKVGGRVGQDQHISTGGGASLEFLAGIELPGVAALER